MPENLDWMSAAAVFGMSPATAAKQTTETLSRRHRGLVMGAHPDREGGDTEEIQKINHANDVLAAWIKAGKPGASAANERPQARQREPPRPPPDPPPRRDAPKPPPRQEAPQERAPRPRARTISELPPPYYVAGIAAVLLIGSFIWPVFHHAPNPSAPRRPDEIAGSPGRLVKSMAILVEKTEGDHSDKTRLINEKYPGIFTRNQYFLACEYAPAAKSESGEIVFFWYKTNPPKAAVAAGPNDDPLNVVKSAVSACPENSREAKATQ